MPLSDTFVFNDGGPISPTSGHELVIPFPEPGNTDGGTPWQLNVDSFGIPIGQGVALLLPAVQAVREAAARRDFAINLDGHLTINATQDDGHHTTNWSLTLDLTSGGSYTAELSDPSFHEVQQVIEQWFADVQSTDLTG